MSQQQPQHTHQQLLEQKQRDLETLQSKRRRMRAMWVEQEQAIKACEKQCSDLTEHIAHLIVLIGLEEAQSQLVGFDPEEQEAIIKGMDKNDYREDSRGSGREIPRYLDLARLVKEVTSIKARHPDWTLTKVRIAMTQDSLPPFHHYNLTFVSSDPDAFQVIMSC